VIQHSYISCRLLEDDLRGMLTLWWRTLLAMELQLRHEVVLLLMLLLRLVFTFRLLRRIPMSRVCHPSFFCWGKPSKLNYYHRRARGLWENLGTPPVAPPPLWARALVQGRGEGLGWRAVREFCFVNMVDPHRMINFTH